jgi:hypothetical protein
VTLPPDDEPEKPAAERPPEPPVMPTAEEAAAARWPAEERPAPVRYAFIVWILAGAFSVLNSSLMLVNKQDLIDYSIKQNRNPSISNEQIARGANTLLWMFLVAAVVFAVLFTLFAYKAQDGIRRARLMLTMLCILTVVFYFFVLRTVPGLMVALLSLIATVLLYTPRANAYFRPRDLPT